MPKGRMKTPPRRATRSGSHKAVVSSKSPMRSRQAPAAPLTPGWTAAHGDMFKLPGSPSPTKTRRVTRRSSVYRKVTKGGRVVGTVTASENAESLLAEFKLPAVGGKRTSVYKRTQIVSSASSPALTRSRRSSFMQRSVTSTSPRRAIKLALSPQRVVESKSQAVQVDSSDEDLENEDDLEISFNFKAQPKATKIPKPAATKVTKKATKENKIPPPSKSKKRSSSVSKKTDESPSKKKRAASPKRARKVEKVSPPKKSSPRRSASPAKKISPKRSSPVKKVSPKKKASQVKKPSSPKRKITKESVQESSPPKRARSASPTKSRSPKKSKNSPRVSIVPTPVKPGEKVNISLTESTPKRSSGLKVHSKKAEKSLTITASPKQPKIKPPTPKSLKKVIKKSPKSTPRHRPQTPSRVKTPARPMTPSRKTSPRNVASVSKKSTKVTTFITPSPDISTPGPKKLPKKLTPGRQSIRTPLRATATPPKAARLLGKTPGGTPLKAARILGKTPGGTPIKAARLLGKTPFQTPMTRSYTPPLFVTPMSESRQKTVTASSVVRRQGTESRKIANTRVYEDSMDEVDDDSSNAETNDTEVDKSGLEIVEAKPKRWSWWSWCTIL